jgi:hypothetical protein
MSRSVTRGRQECRRRGNQRNRCVTLTQYFGEKSCSTEDAIKKRLPIKRRKTILHGRLVVRMSVMRRFQIVKKQRVLGSCAR